MNFFSSMNAKLPLLFFSSDNGNGIGHTSSLQGGGGGDIASIRKPTRLEALPSMGGGGGGLGGGVGLGLGKSNIKSKKSVPVLNTMGTF